MPLSISLVSDGPSRPLLQEKEGVLAKLASFGIEEGRLSILSRCGAARRSPSRAGRLASAHTLQRRRPQLPIGPPRLGPRPPAPPPPTAYQPPSLARP
eukprot:1014875-Prymnesium_polylepis.1